MKDENLKTKLGEEYRQRTIKGEEKESDSFTKDFDEDGNKRPEIITEQDLKGDNGQDSAQT